MPSLFSRLASSFPAHTGPYAVGSIDVEIPIADLPQPFETPCPDSGITTLAFRLYYPCVEPTVGAKSNPAYWIPHPQDGHVQHFAKFLGAGEALSRAFQYFPHLLTHIRLSAHNNAKPLPPPAATTDSSSRWPLMIFSHGLAGQRTSYSHICSCMASHGMVVVAPEHRDGSAPVSYIAQDAPEHTPKIQPYTRFSHTPSDEVWRARDRQLRVRLWELGLLVEGLAKIDSGAAPPNLRAAAKHTPNDALSWFRDVYDVRTPGKVTFAGHSFGACTTLQLTKSVYWAVHQQPDDGAVLDSAAPAQTILFTPNQSATISSLVTPTTPTILLDMWTLPLRSPFTQYLANLPMPHFVPENPNGGGAILAVLSSAFANWKDNTDTLKRVLSDPYEVAPMVESAAPMANGILKNPYLSALIQNDAISMGSAHDSGYESETASQAAPSELSRSTSIEKPREKAHIFYPLRSAHLSQSDYGVLFPTLTKYLAKGQDPERTIRLNVRAICEILRRSDIALEPSKDMPIVDDRILSTQVDSVRGWVCVDVSDVGEEVVEEVAAMDAASLSDDKAASQQTVGEKVQSMAEYGGKA
ncbi:hypothetical protein FH972_022160 [Carpinus fangiana]|uniref:1-alkyl-2-acetylglycerophosphocholine esterase n=1 Tax=Carpinus fangiana TaxID=176857 RepID=A0A5N6KRF0_9ROSI|nr:hypothetical protein FH972_022160 [Carpinus fangiana]